MLLEQATDRLFIAFSHYMRTPLGRQLYGFFGNLSKLRRLAKGINGKTTSTRIKARYARVPGEWRLIMKATLTIIVISMLLAGMLVAAGADGVLDLSTLGKKSIDTINIPMISQNMPSVPATSLGENATPQVIDLSTLGKKIAESTVAPVVIKGAAPITITPMFAIKNQNITSEANTVFTLPQAIAANSTVYTPPIAIFGGA